MPNFTAFHLRARSGFRAELRSDTLWSTLMWGLSLLDEQRFSGVFAASIDPAGGEEAFYVSSAFPFLDPDGSTARRIHYLPSILLPTPPTAPESVAPNLAKAKTELRIKKQDRQFAYWSQPAWSYLAGLEDNKAELPVFQSAPKLNKSVTTHVTIDRGTGSTLTLNSGGQLFHAPEQRWESRVEGGLTGQYFLASGNTAIIDKILRFLRHTGIGGDRTTGKGTFEYLGHYTFHLPGAAQANAVTNLSLYHPTVAERQFLENVSPGNRMLNYRLLDRQGRMSAEYMRKGKYLKDAIPYFREGSTFPLDLLKVGPGQHPGECPPAQRLLPGNPARQYGFGLMVPIKIR